MSPIRGFDDREILRFDLLEDRIGRMLKERHRLSIAKFLNWELLEGKWRVEGRRKGRYLLFERTLGCFTNLGQRSYFRIQFCLFFLTLILFRFFTEEIIWFEHPSFLLETSWQGLIFVSQVSMLPELLLQLLLDGFHLQST